MKVEVLKNALTSRVGRQILLTQKNSPKILFVAGVAGMVGATYLACKATLKVGDVLDDMEKTHVALNGLDYRSERHEKKAHARVNAQGAIRIVRLYAPAVGVGVISVGMLTKSHMILTERNAAVMAAYSALDKGFTEYRKRVVDELGEDKDREFRYGTETRTETIQGSEGAKTVENKVIPEGPPGAHSIYAVFFDEFNPNWERKAEFNRIFLQHQQVYMNDLLRSRGHVFLNDVYDALGFDRTQAGSVVGWLLRRDGQGDNFIDFGIFDGDDWKVRSFVNGTERSILLDFNVDGVIWDKI